jgi:hypothetical protein
MNYIKKARGDCYDKLRCLQECATEGQVGIAKAIFAYTFIKKNIIS